LKLLNNHLKFIPREDLTVAKMPLIFFEKLSHFDFCSFYKYSKYRYASKMIVIPYTGV